MAKNLQVRYTIQGGSLPNGLTLNPDTGLISGTVGFDALGVGPAWTGPAAGSLGSYNENDTLTKATFSTTSSKGPVIYSITTGFLPWGVTFSPTTGVLQGTIAPLKLRVAEQASTSDGPTWNTSFGKLVQVDEVAPVNLTLSATPLSSRTLKSYSIVAGFLPFGIKLNAVTGVISGTTAILKNPGPFVDVPKLPLPVWNNDNTTTLTTINEGDSASITLSATPTAGRSMSRYLVVGGFLPFGFKLNPTTGVVSGTAAEIRIPDTFVPDATKAIQILDAVGGGAGDVLDGGNIVTVSKGGNVYNGLNCTISSPTNNFAGNIWCISKGALPFGLKISNNGVISGTVVNNARVRSGVYSFTVMVIQKKTESPGQWFTASRNYTITVN